MQNGSAQLARFVGDMEMTLLDEIIKKQKWPSKGMKVFTTDVDWWNQASISYYRKPEKLSLYAEGYKIAGDLIIDYVKKNRIEQDALIYPMVFLYRHYIELVLKDIIKDSRKIFDEKVEFPETHKISSLWQIVKGYLRRTKDLNNTKDIESVDKIMEEFAIQDPDSMSFRYPEDKKGNELLSNLNNVNLRQIADVVDALHSYFFGVQSILGELLSVKYDL